jgi:hypothetical protein
MKSLFSFLLLACAPFALAKEITTNNIHMADAPAWLTQNRVEKIIDHIQMVLEWDIRRIEVYWYKDQASFEKAHGLGPVAMAVSKKGDSTIHLGPKVDSANFDPVFGHELVHIISGQKYKEAIPKWLEEGLANYLAKLGKVDYKYLASRPLPADVRTLTHPYNAVSVDGIHYHYVASQALTEMIAKKCDLHQLLQLSVGKSKDCHQETSMECYLDTYCDIKDLNAEYKKWVSKHK